MIPDDEFIQSKKVPGPTKEEIRCLVMCKAEYPPRTLWLMWAVVVEV